MVLKTRQPTGRATWPLILVEGPEMSGKTFAAAALSASPKVGQTYWLDLGEGAADEYGALPGSRYLIVEHDGSWPTIYGAVEELHSQAQRAAESAEPPVVLVVDSMTAEWDLLKDWTTNRAKKSRTNRQKLAADPNAEIVVATNYWNDANTRHRKLMRLLMTFPGIVVMAARGKDIAAIGEDGKPIEGRREYRVEGHKGLGYDASCWIRLSREQKPLVVGARSVHSGVRPGIDDPKPLPDDWTLEWVIFEALRCDPAVAQAREVVEIQPGDEAPESPRFTAFMAGVEGAPDLESLRRMWPHIGAAQEQGDITEAEAEKVRAAVLAARGEFEPARPKPPAEDGPDTGGGPSDQQHRRMHALWNEIGMAGDNMRWDRLTQTSRIVGRDIDTSKQLTSAEADKVIDHLVTQAGKQKQDVPA